MLLGGFDGLHVGHKRLVESAKRYGVSVGLMTIVGGKVEAGLFTMTERMDIFRRAGVDFVFELPFAEIKDITPENFALLLQREFMPQVFICGDDFRFGAKAAGTPEMLKQATHVCVETHDLVQADGKKISSGTIKQLLKAGEVEKANALLGERFFLIGEVFADRKVGRTIGFPTANIKYPKDKFPLKIGVYETRVAVDGKEYKGITNYGSRPTFENQAVLTETYLDGFNGDLYGKTLKIQFVRYLRDVQKFDNADRLSEQLEKDVRRVRNEN